MVEQSPLNRDRAENEARRWASEFDFELGEVIAARYNPSQSWWVLAFNFKEERPDWCYLTCIGGDGSRSKFVAVERSDHFSSIDPDELPVNFTWKNLLEDWANASRSVARTVTENGVFNQSDPWCDEYRELNDKLQRATLQEIDAFPVSSFGAIGDIVAVMRPEAATWLLPILLRCGSVSSESIYARSVIDTLRQRISKMATWSEIKGKISPVTRDWLCQLARSCCERGWKDQRRRVNRAVECTEVLC